MRVDRIGPDVVGRLGDQPDSERLLSFGDLRDRIEASEVGLNGETASRPIVLNPSNRSGI